MGGSLIIIAVCMFLMPSIPSYVAFSVLRLVFMVAVGPIELDAIHVSSICKYLLHEWKDDLTLPFSEGLELFRTHEAVALQIIHIFYTFGQMTAAVMVKPFVSKGENSTADVCDGDQEQQHQHENEDDSGVSKTAIAFAICALICILASSYMLVIWIGLKVRGCRRRGEESCNYTQDAGASITNSQDTIGPLPLVGRIDGVRTDVNNDSESLRDAKRDGFDSTETLANHPSSPSSGILVENYSHTKFTKAWTVFWAALMLSFESGLEGITFAYMFNYLSYSGVEKDRALDINSFLNISYIVSRVIVLFVNLKVPVKASLIFCLLLASVSILGLIFARQNRTLVMVLCILLGAGFSLNYPSMNAFINDRIRMTSAIGGIIFS